MKLIIANWKNNPNTAEEAVGLIKKTDQEGLVICPSEKFIANISPYIKKGKMGAQDLFWEENSPSKIDYVIVGHSDRRYTLGESDRVVAEKFSLAVNQGLSPILCVGETLEQKQRGEREQVVEREIISAFRALNPIPYNSKNIYIAYEPVWAISSSKNSKPDNPENAVTAIQFIKGLLTGVAPQLFKKIKFLYGGSIDSDNAYNFLKQPEIEGALVGRSSLNPKELGEIVRVARNQE